jgi:hypothetical protein
METSGIVAAWKGRVAQPYPKDLRLTLSIVELLFWQIVSHEHGVDTSGVYVQGVRPDRHTDTV